MNRSLSAAWYELIIVPGLVSRLRQAVGHFNRAGKLRKMSDQIEASAMATNSNAS